jgi:tetratricopeptide (TPR) repeat protein
MRFGEASKGKDMMLGRLLTFYEKGRLYTMPDPKPKPDLVALCRDILSEMNVILQGAGTDLRSDFLFKLTALYNRAALAHYQLGNYQRAEKLCHKAIAMCGEVEPAGAKAWFLAVLQPYVNIARLAMAEGNWMRALKLLEGVRRFTEYGTPLQVSQNILPSCSDFCTEDECREIANFGRTVFITDSLRALLLADQYCHLDEFTETWLQTQIAKSPEFWMMLKEASARTAFLTGRHERSPTTPIRR